MNHVTRCPNCQTAFKVSESQLAAHGGKVRCGKCSFVFNARACLEETLAEPEPVPQQVAVEPAPAPVATPAAVPAPPIALPEPIASTPPAPAPVEPPVADEPAAVAHAPAEGAQAPEPSVAEMVIAARKARLAAKAVAAQAASEQEEARTEAVPAPIPVPVPSPISEKPKADPRDQEALKAALKESPLTLNSVYRPIRSLEDEALLTPPEPPSRWRWLAIPLCLLLTLALIAQAGLYFRNQLATDFPWLRPPLVAACAQLGCAMPLPRNAELLRSDYSELTYLPDHNNLIQLSASVRNLAPYAQALPTLELTLTNAREEVVAKKRFPPAEYLVNSEKGRGELGSNDELHAMLQIDVGDLSSTGYTIYWFYP
ncbi:DUF3426 domain-containing protein [Chitinolyticbacter meiyuanensis]|uniref:DUF3426 domain-containing protein n=1 Tax=Chitinolyticbacter meiyuanensis TaxID=682798 RepID=UPI0011E5D9A4|nr:DUF3426 domain-containing protein [Chitinolyticbacter meiyuanensis]